ncbi:MAG TPA: hypothetical protein VJN91_02530, partial [Gammaproteobacteria bacterium]|nr:hypothetical protein [Gammaproteobacteria bacterium]
MGLGVWSDNTRRFYPARTIRRVGRLAVDTFEGRNLLVYVDPATTTLVALFIDSAQARLEGAEILLGNGQRVRAGRLVDADNAPVATERPQQIFSRWYGFSLTFPDPEIYESAK